MYNYAADQLAGVDKMVKRIVHWHNARSLLLTSLLSQKMGLFHHTTFAELPNRQGKLQVSVVYLSLSSLLCQGGICICVCVCACVCVCVCVCMCVCACMFVFVCVHTCICQCVGEFGCICLCR